MQRNLATDGSAVGQVIAFMVAAAIFVGALGAILIAARGVGRNDLGSHQANKSLEAERLADLLVSSSGVGWSNGNDGVTRLGLMATNGSGLSAASLDALRGAGLASAANGKVDYADAAASLGAAGGNFRIRVYPVALPDTYTNSLAGLRTAYIGDWTSLASVTVPAGTPAQMASSAQVALNTTMLGATANERAALRALGVSYNDKVYITTLSPTILVTQPVPLPALPLLTVLNVPLLEGDVYPDVKSYLDANLATRLPLYRVLVVGSGVDQSTLTSNVVKSAIRDWVLAGGTLVVLGSSNANYQWLQPLYSVGVASAPGPLSAPDAMQPLLREPYALDWTRYEAHGTGWDISAPGANSPAAEFNHVVMAGGRDVLAASHDGAFGKGRIILTSVMPRELAATLGPLEAQHLLANAILYSDRTNLRLDYGPAIPANTDAAVAVRNSYQWDPKLGLVPERVEVVYWR